MDHVFLYFLSPLKKSLTSFPQFIRHRGPFHHSKLTRTPHLLSKGVLVTALTAVTKYLPSLRKISWFDDNDEKGITGRRMRQLVMNLGAQWVSLLLIGVSSLWGQIVPLMRRVDVPSSIEAIWKYPHRCVSQVVLNILVYLKMHSHTEQRYSSFPSRNYQRSWLLETDVTSYLSSQWQSTTPDSDFCLPGRHLAVVKPILFWEISRKK